MQACKKTRAFISRPKLLLFAVELLSGKKHCLTLGLVVAEPESNTQYCRVVLESDTGLLSVNISKIHARIKRIE